MTALSRCFFAAAAAAMFGVVANVPAAAEFTPKQTKAIEAIIKDYLLKNPEVLRDAFNELERRQRNEEVLAQRKAIQAQKAALFEDPNSIVVGNPKGDVVLVEFFDYNCGYCKKSAADLAKLMAADPKLKVVLKDFPILGPDSVAASRIAVAAKSLLPPDKYWTFHFRLMVETKGRVGKDAALSVAKSMGINPAELEQLAGSRPVEDSLRKIMDIADSLGINGTPAFVIGDQVISGAVGVAPLTKAIASVRKCGKVEC